ncbi:MULTISPECIES: hypothetical protein [unclassified Prochlorococcus]|uniref:hypothetical protein n=1 Tax=unclassified Prochlorococcus TaxID=2627481 RepID=UPI000533B64C|nr:MULTISPECIES: hypothetical protein [unclassified Prochlorococcus]KGG15126.1 hypothetical protein EV06_0991 [Prochlorococcus sp. MIT 0602]KGG17398.1 hypothetical protein EV07_0837 [Prochlorococcus sp. MIT 0603]
MNCKIKKKIYPNPIRIRDYISNKSIRNNQSKSFIYVLFSNLDNKIRIVLEKERTKIAMNESYQAIGKKLGSERELNLVKLTLKEFGHNYLTESNNYNFSKNLIKNLNTLGYLNSPIGKFKKEYYSK